MDLTFNSTGTDTSYLTDINTFLPTLFGLTIFKTAWPVDQLGSQETLQKGADWYREMFEGGRTGNRYHIAARKLAREDLDGRIHKILRYLSVMADENDTKALLQSGVVKIKIRKRARKTAKSTSSNG